MCHGFDSHSQQCDSSVGRAIEVYAGSNPAPIKFGWTSPVSQQQTENLSLQSASLFKRCTRKKTDLSLSVKRRILDSEISHS